MEKFPDLLEKKRIMDNYYRKELSNVGDIEFQEISKDVEANCWLFTFKTKKMRPLLDYLNNNGVMSRPFWMPMNQLEMFKNDLYVTENDNSSSIYETCISIPSSAGINEQEMREVVSKIKEFYTTLIIN